MGRLLKARVRKQNLGPQLFRTKQGILFDEGLIVGIAMLRSIEEQYSMAVISTSGETICVTCRSFIGCELKKFA